MNLVAKRHVTLTTLDLLVTSRDLGETIKSGPLCITDLFNDKSVAYYLLIAAFI